MPKDSNIGEPWTPIEREIAFSLHGKKSYRGIVKALKEAGFTRTVRAVESFLSRAGNSIDDIVVSTVPTKKICNSGKLKPLKTTWGSQLLVKKLEVEFARASNIAPVLIVPDMHAPFHDERAIELLCKAAEIIKPVALVYLGDNVDWVQLSRFEKHPDFLTKAYEEVVAWQKVDKQLVSAIGEHARRYYILGNHEKRFFKWSVNNPETMGFRGMQFDAILGLDENFEVLKNIQFVEDEISWRKGRFVFKHGEHVRKWSGYSAKAEMEKEMTSGISGHTHRLAAYYLTNRGQSKVWVESGHLALPNPGYVNNPNWQQGFTVGWFNGNGGNDYFHVDPIPIVNYQAIVNGEYIKV